MYVGMQWPITQHPEQTLPNHHMSEVFLWFNCVGRRGQFSYCVVSGKVSNSGYVTYVYMFIEPIIIHK